MRKAAAFDFEPRRKPREGFILDCSVTMAWCFDEATPYTDAVRNSLTALRALVPTLWPLEVANVALVSERRKRLDETRTLRFLTLLKMLPIIVDDETCAHAWSDALQLARAHRLSMHDASYLELAIRRGLPLATQDGKLKAAAQAVSVPLFAAA